MSQSILILITLLEKQFTKRADELTEHYYNLLGDVIYHRSLKGVELAIQLGADINTLGSRAQRCSNTYHSPLMLACSLANFSDYTHDYSHFKIIQLLLERGADVQVTDFNGNTPLAALITNELNLKNNTGSAQFAAHFTTFKNIIQEFIQKGVDVNKVNNQNLESLQVLRNIYTDASGYRYEESKKKVWTLEQLGEISELLQKNGAIKRAWRKWRY